MVSLPLTHSDSDKVILINPQRSARQLIRQTTINQLFVRSTKKKGWVSKIVTSGSPNMAVLISAAEQGGNWIYGLIKSKGFFDLSQIPKGKSI